MGIRWHELGHTHRMEPQRGIPFAKLHGLGNDFIVINATTSSHALRQIAPVVCARRTGIGADGIVLVMPSEIADCRMMTINADGSEAEMCGNAARCAALYVYRQGWHHQPDLHIETAVGLIKVERVGEEAFRVDMRPPVLDAARIPTAGPDGRVLMAPVQVEDRTFEVTGVSMGPPHAVIYAEDLSDELVLNYGPKLATHPFFPKGANIDFIKVLAEDEIQMRVWERGVGETMACGTGACAAVVAGVLSDQHGHDVTVHLPGGDLSIEWDGAPTHSVFMTGPAAWVYDGQL